MSPIRNVALVNELGQVVNHVVVDTDDTETIANLHEHWGTTRFVETNEEEVIILHASDEIWTTHCNNPSCDKHGFNLPDLQRIAEIDGNVIIAPPVPEKEFVEITIGGKKYPSDSLLIKENAHLRPEGYQLPEGVEEISLED